MKSLKKIVRGYLIFFIFRYWFFISFYDLLIFVSDFLFFCDSWKYFVRDFLSTLPFVKYDNYGILFGGAHLILRPCGGRSFQGGTLSRRGFSLNLCETQPEEGKSCVCFLFWGGERARILSFQKVKYLDSKQNNKVKRKNYRRTMKQTFGKTIGKVLDPCAPSRFPRPCEKCLNKETFS